MDDQTFDEKTALDWIRMVEVGSARERPGDIYPRLKQWLEKSSPSEILEIGSGQGICSKHIDLANCSYTGVEPSPFLVDRAKTLYLSERRTFLRGDAYGLPFSDASFDAVFSVLVWHLLGDLKKSAYELSRVLKTNAPFLIITANPASYPAWTGFYGEHRLVGNRFEGFLKLPDGTLSKDVLYFHTLDEIRTSLESEKLQINECDTFRESEKGEPFLIAIQGRKN